MVHDQFSRFFYETETPFNLTWMGVQVVKCPFDLWMYTEILHATKPDLVIETGSFQGGSALYLAHMQDLIGHGNVLSVDINPDRELPEHPRVEFLLGKSSVDRDVISYVSAAAQGKRCMVVLDSAHNRKHVLAEMNAYSGLVAKGCYLIVEDTNVHGYPFGVGDIDDDGGPAEAVRDWQPTNKGFECDRSKERLRMSQNPGGFLLRVR